MPSESTAAALRRRSAALAQVEAATQGRANGVRVSISDDSAAGGAGFDRLFQLVGALAALDDVLAAAVPYVREEHAANFATEGANGRGAWAPLAERTQRERARLGYNPAGPILSRTGATRRHVLTAPAVISRRGTLFQLTIAPGPVVAGVPKYRALAKGLPARNLPGRPMVAVGPAGARRLTSVISRDLRRRAGLT